MHTNSKEIDILLLGRHRNVCGLTLKILQKSTSFHKFSNNQIFLAFSLHFSAPAKPGEPFMEFLLLHAEVNIQCARSQADRK